LLFFSVACLLLFQVVDIRRVMCVIMEDMDITMERDPLNPDKVTLAMDMPPQDMVTIMGKGQLSLDMDTVVMEDMDKDMVIEDMAITMAKDLLSLDMDTIVMEVMGIEDMDMVMDTEDKLKLKLLEFSIIEVSIMLSQSHMLKYINHAP
jgi:hypothetical protein